MTKGITYFLNGKMGFQKFFKKLISCDFSLSLYFFLTVKYCVLQILNQTHKMMSKLMVGFDFCAVQHFASFTYLKTNFVSCFFLFSKSFFTAVICLSVANCKMTYTSYTQLFIKFVLSRNLAKIWVSFIATTQPPGLKKNSAD